MLRRLASLVALVWCLAPGAQANNLSPKIILKNTDYRSVGVGGLRDVGSGRIKVEGVSGTVTKAMLYWHGDTSTPATSALVEFNGESILGSEIGRSYHNGWDPEYTVSETLQADVTSLVTGNGTYSLSGFTIINPNGASLVIFFNDGEPDNNHDIYVFAGNDSNVGTKFDATGWLANLVNVSYVKGPTSHARLELHVGDGQTWEDANLYLSGQLLEAGPAVFNGNSVPSENNGPYDNGSLWDIRSFDVTNLLAPAGSPASLVQTAALEDALSLVVAVVDLWTTPPDLVILPETTRWKPQQSDAPMTIKFTGPDDLDLSSAEAGTLQIAGAMGVKEIVGPVSLVAAGQPKTYSMTWSGPWTYPDANDLPQRLPAANYTIRVKARRQNGDETAFSGSYDKVSLVEVKAVKVNSLGANEGGAATEGMGNGSTRVFAEADSPDGPVRDRVEIEATIVPVLVNAADVSDDRELVTVYFRSLDVDDPANGSPVDLDGDGQPFDVADNRGAPSAGSLDAPGVIIPGGQSKGHVRLQASTRQGDNYRVAASTSLTWLNKLWAAQPSQSGQVLGLAGDDLPTGPQAGGPLSEMLTVWRTVRIPVVRFDLGTIQQNQLDALGTWKMVTARQLIDPKADFQGTYDHQKPNDWVGAYLRPCRTFGLSAAAFYVESNHKTIMQVTEGSNMQPEAAKCLADKLYSVSDDEFDSIQYANGDLSLANDLLASAYIKVVYEDAGQMHALILGAGGTQNMAGIYQFAMAGLWKSNKNYWTVPLLLAFEGDVDEDADPTYEVPDGLKESTSTNGQTTPTIPPVAAVYNETIADHYRPGFVGDVPFFFARRSTTAHEILHGFGLTHDGDASGGLMCGSLMYSADVPNRAKITKQQLATVRGAEQPEGGPGKNTCP